MFPHILVDGVVGEPRQRAYVFVDMDFGFRNANRLGEPLKLYPNDTAKFALAH